MRRPHAQGEGVTAKGACAAGQMLVWAIALAIKARAFYINTPRQMHYE